MTRTINAAISLFSAICIGLGVQSYFFPRAGHDASLISLVAAAGIGVMMLLSLGIWKYLNPRGGRIFTLVLCVFCLGRFIPSWLSKGTFYPNGLMTVLAVALAGILLAGHFAAQKEKQNSAAS